MDTWVWVLITIVVVAIAAIAAWYGTRRRRTDSLRRQFGPEYDRTVEEAGPREAESELEERRRRRGELDIRPLPPGARTRYVEEWRGVQARFVDDPTGALAQADALVSQVMRERGYPMDDFDQRAADVSVDHPGVVEDYRAAHDISTRAGEGRAETEDLRQAMIHYRRLFDELLEDASGEPQRQAT